MKYDWKKEEKQFYLPKNKPETVEIPESQYLVLEGSGNPNDPFFSKYIEALFSISYTIKMSPKKNTQPEGYFEYSVYPLEGIWGLSDEAVKNYKGTLNKDDLVFKLMIKQPTFVTQEYLSVILPAVMTKTKNELAGQAKLEKIQDGLCVQMLHIGSFDSEPESFKKMEDFARDNQMTRIGKNHREIYMSDFRKVEKDKLKTVLRFWVKP